MGEKINPYYNSSKLGLDLLQFEGPNEYYSFDTLAFWRTEDGRIYTAHDAGCSCPTPFEDYEGETLGEVLQKLERVGSVDQALRSFDAWKAQLCPGDQPFPSHWRDSLADWVKKHLKS